MGRSIHQPRRDPYTGDLLDEPHWMLNAPGQRMPYPPGRHCTNPECRMELSRYDRGPLCWPCHAEQQKAARLAALLDEEAAA